MSTDHEVRRQVTVSLVPGHGTEPFPVRDLSLYVHIPFCSSRCRYCNFYFETGWSDRILDRTLDTILEESKWFRQRMFVNGLASIKSIYIGGGTPSVIPLPRLDRFLKEFREIWDLNDHDSGFREATPEFAFEANPESITLALLETLAANGVNRLSIGIQSFDTQVLQGLGRRGDESENLRALMLIRWARAQGIWNGALNLDLIIGAPGQSEDGIKRDVERLLSFAPDHLSIYTLTVEDFTPLGQSVGSGNIDLPSPESCEQMWEIADTLIESAGLHNYEISNYSRPGKESRHNTAYWRLRPYLGLGPGAVGTIPMVVDGYGNQPRPARITNPQSAAYSRLGRTEWQHAVEIPSNSDFLLDHFLTGLRLEEGLNLDRLEQIFHLGNGGIQSVIGDLIYSWREKGYLAGSGSILCFTREARFVLNRFLVELAKALEPHRALIDGLPPPLWPLP